MKNILLISQYFAPRNIIASIRFTKMVKYLARTKEYYFWVICIGTNKDEIRDELLQKDIEEVSEYVTVLPVTIDKKLVKSLKSIFIGKKKSSKYVAEKVSSETKKDVYYTIQKNFVSCKQKGIVGNAKRLFGKIMLLTNDIYDIIYEVLFARRGIVLSRQIPIDDIDVMISTYGSIGSLLLALKFKTIRKNMKWIVDYRDPVRGVTGVQQKYFNYIVNRADQKADYITGVSASCIGSGNCMEKFHIIPNGFDREDINGFESRKNNKKLTIVYTGTLLSEKCDMSLLFKIMSELEAEGLLNSENISILYAGDHFHVLLDQARAWNMTKILVNKGRLPRERALKLQYQADILCVLAWNREGDTDILTGKVLEYIMMRRPIFAVVTGNKSGSILKRIVQGVNLGYCLEEAEVAQYYNEAKEWFFRKYQEFVQTGNTICEAEECKIKEYSSVKMAEKFEDLIDRCYE